MNKNNGKNNGVTKTVKSVALFVLIMLMFYFVGYGFGRLIRNVEEGGFSFLKLFNNINIDNYAAYALPCIFIAMLLIAGAVNLAFYLKSKNQFKVWDGEDEDSINQVEFNLSKVMLISNIVLIISYFLFGLWIYVSESQNVTLDEKILKINSFVVVVLFVVSIIFSIIIQRCVVELEKKINPEKRGEILNMNFQKEWEQSCDEAEMTMVYKSAYKAFKATNNTCVVLWVISIICLMILKTGILPILFVTVLWLVSTITYQIEAIKLENKK